MVQVHSGPLSGVIAQLVERQLCKLDVRSSSLLSSRKHRPGATRYPTEDIGNIEISAWKLTKQSSIQSDLKHQEKTGGFELLMRQNRAESLELGFKRRNARGGCLGIRRRRRTGQAPKVPCEAQRAFDHGGSEWGNPRASVSTYRIHRCEEANPGN